MHKHACACEFDERRIEMQYEVDDPPPPKRRWWDKHWEVWKMTWLVQLVWMGFYGLFFLTLSWMGWF